jgi:hypothetical protein
LIGVELGSDGRRERRISGEWRLETEEAWLLGEREKGRERERGRCNEKKRVMGLKCLLMDLSWCTHVM